MTQRALSDENWQPTIRLASATNVVHGGCVVLLTRNQQLLHASAEPNKLMVVRSIALLVEEANLAGRHHGCRCKRSRVTSRPDGHPDQTPCKYRQCRKMSEKRWRQSGRAEKRKNSMDHHAVNRIQGCTGIGRQYSFAQAHSSPPNRAS